MRLLKVALVIFLVQNSINLFAQAVNISDATIAAIPEQRWSNDSIKPALTVTYNDVQLAVNTDYTAVYTDNVNKGTATVTITGKGNYTGTSSATFVIADFPLLDPESPNSEENPYLISTEEDLKALAGIVNSRARNTGFYKQTRDITLTKEHIAIGTTNGSYDGSNYNFKGTYDGDNYNVNNIVISKTGTDFTYDSYQGFFGIASGDAKILNVNVVDCNISAYKNVGGIMGYANTSCIISNCSVSGTISGSQQIGGIVGYTCESTVKNCTNSATVCGDYYAGGITGEMRVGSVSEQNINLGAVTGKKSSIGGVAGIVYRGTLTNNFNAASVTVDNEKGYVGGIIGNYSGTDTYIVLTDNYYISGNGLSGAVGTNFYTSVTTPYDVPGEAEIVSMITAADDVELILPATPACVWNGENYYTNGTEITLGYDVPTGKVFDCYTVSNGFLSNAGVQNGTHVLTDMSENVHITASYADGIVNIEGNATISGIPYLTFNGLQQHPKPVVKIGQTVLEESKNYELSYSDGCIDAGYYTVTVTGTGRYTGTLTKEFRINTYYISTDNTLEITGLDDSYPKTGNVINPVPGNISCKATGNTALTLDTDYTLSYSDGCTLPGKYTLTITGKGNYSGQKNIDFEICDAFGFTVNDGTATSYESPFSTQSIYYYQKNEFIVSKEAISALNGKTLYGLKFYLARIPVSPSAYENKIFKVFIKEVNSTNATTYSGMDNATIV